MPVLLVGLHALRLTELHVYAGPHTIINSVLPEVAAQVPGIEARSQSMCAKNYV